MPVTKRAFTKQWIPSDGQDKDICVWAVDMNRRCSTFAGFISMEDQFGVCLFLLACQMGYICQCCFALITPGNNKLHSFGTDMIKYSVSKKGTYFTFGVDM